MVYILAGKIQSNRDYHFRLVYGAGKARAELNGKLVREWYAEGTLQDKKQAFHLGSQPRWPFIGNIYEVKIRPFKPIPPAPKAPAKSDFDVEVSRPWKINNPAGTVIIKDFSKFTPKPVIGKIADPQQWSFRPVKFFAESPGCLHPPVSPHKPEISYNPELKGKYDIWFGVRVLNRKQKIDFRIGDSKDYYSIQIGATKTVHRNIQILAAKGVDLTNQTIQLAPGGLFYLGYIKLMPSGSSPKPLEYSRIKITRGPRRDNTEEMKKRIASGYFIERHFVEPRAKPVPTDKSLKRGFLVFNWNWMNLLFRQSVPFSDPGRIVLKAAAAPGEYEPVTFGVRALRDMKMTLSGRMPAGIEAKIAVVEYAVKRTTNYTGRSEFVNIPQYLEDTATVEIKKGESRQFWLTLHAPEDAKPGIYKSEFILNGMKIPIEFTVYPFRLEPVKNYSFGFWTTVPNHAKAREIMRQHAARGMNTIMINDENLFSIKGTQIDFNDAIICSIAEAFKKYHWSGPIMLQSNLLRAAAMSAGPEKRDAVYKKLTDQLETYGVKHNWPKIVYNSVDEALSSPKRLPQFIWEVNLQKKLGLVTANDHIWYKTSRPYQKQVDQVVNSIDIFINRFNTRKLFYVDDWITMMKTAVSRDKKLIAYNSNNAVDFTQTAMMRFANGWFFRTVLGSRCYGQLYWTYFRSSGGSVFNDLDGTDWCYFYPPEGNRRGGPAINFEAFREGIDDLRYILTLEKLIAEAKRRKIDVVNIQKIINSLQNSFDTDLFWKKSVFFDSHWEKEWNDKSGKRFASGQLRLPNGWKNEDYKVARNKIARTIIHLQKQLGNRR